MEKTLRFLAKPWVFFLICAAIFAIWIAWAFIVRAMIPNSWPNRGLSGDMFGGINALFTGLAFAGLLYTIILQKLNLVEGEKEKKRQTFEATFFQLLRSLESIIDTMDLEVGTSDKPSLIKGRDCFTLLFNRLDASWFNGQYGDISGLDRAKTVYAAFYPNYQTDLGHYYRTMYHVFKFIALSCPEDKTFYAHLVRAQLSSQQLLLLFYNGMSIWGEGFNEYVAEFSLLKHLPKELIRDQALIAFYPPKAYGSKSIDAATRPVH